MRRPDPEKNNNCIAIMQPYIFPYVGYFQLINASNIFVFYDDVQYISRGWINRNRLLQQNSDLLFTIPVQKKSRDSLINEIKPCVNKKWQNKFYKQLQHSYSKAPYFNNVVDQIMAVFLFDHADISDLAIQSILAVFSYLGISFQYLKSSQFSPETRSKRKADRLIAITKKLGSKHYINPIGGKTLYTKEQFRKQGICLYFLLMKSISYKQKSDQFIPDLSIIDLLMFNNKDQVKSLFTEYTLE